MVRVEFVDVAPQVDRLAHVAAESAVQVGALLAGRGLLAVLGDPGLDGQVLGLNPKELPEVEIEVIARLEFSISARWR